MKNYITVAAFLAAGAAFANADVNAVVLTPTGPGETGENASGIAAEDVWGYDLYAWHGTWENEALVNQVSFSEGSLSLQIGAASDGAGNFAAVKFAISITIARFTASPTTERRRCLRRRRSSTASRSAPSLRAKPAAFR